jgi:hypothetical protein
MDKFIEDYIVNNVDLTNVLLGVAWGLALICLGLMIW